VDWHQNTISSYSECNKNPTFSSANIVDPYFPRLNLFKSLHMSINQIGYINVVSYACSIWCLIVSSSNLHGGNRYNKGFTEEAFHMILTPKHFKHTKSIMISLSFSLTFVTSNICLRYVMGFFQILYISNYH